MRERRQQQQAVVLPDLRLEQLGVVQGDRRRLRVQHPLGATGGSAGEVDGGRSSRRQVRHDGEALVRCVGQVGQAASVGQQIRASVGDLEHGRGGEATRHRRIDDDGLRRCAIEDVGDRLGRQHVVDRELHRSEPRDRHVTHDELGAVPQVEGDHVTGAQPDVVQLATDGTGPRVEVCVGQLGVVALDRHLLGVGGQRVAELFSQRCSQRVLPTRN